MRAVLNGRRARAGSEAGSALVAAVAVVAVCVGLGSVVVTQAIVVSRDSGKDRTRTIEVHGAEGAVDAMYAALETTTPCTWPASGYSVVNTAKDQVGVSVKIAYYDSTNKALTCTNGVVSGGTPAQAVITSTAKDTAAAAGASQRKVQAKVLLSPLQVQGSGAAIFASSSLDPNNSTINVGSTTGGPAADVWIDSGDFQCANAWKITGNVIVAGGKTRLANSQCAVTGNLWSKGTLQIDNAGTTIGGHAMVANGDALFNNAPTIGGDLLVSGALTGANKTPNVAGTIETGSKRIPVYLPVGLPEVNYTPADWSGFAFTTFPAWTKQQSIDNGAPTYSDVRTGVNGCTNLSGDNYSLNGRLLSPTTPTVLNAMSTASPGCPSGVQFGPNVEIRLRSDLAIFVDSIAATNGVKVTSYDGAVHKLWIINPDPVKDGVTKCAASNPTTTTINLIGSTMINAPVNVFLYSPCKVILNNNGSLYGQVYGSTVSFPSDPQLKYVPMGIPGVTFPSLAPVTASGMRVDIVYKREIGK
jgi:hypothetical protein